MYSSSELAREALVKRFRLRKKVEDLEITLVS
jgi:hypothetical protein